MTDRIGDDGIEGELDVFISYAHDDAVEEDDRHPARELADLLTAEGYSVWWDRGLVPSEDWSLRLEEQVRRARRVIGLLSPRSVASKWCHGEMWIASNTPGKLIPVIIDECDVPSHLKRIQSVRAVGNVLLAKPLILAALQLTPSRRPARGPTAPLNPDLRIAIDALPTGTAQFVGRDAELSLLRKAWASGNAASGPTKPEKTNAVVFHAIGGAGKSALIRRFLDELADAGWPGAQRVYGWSAYSQGSGDNKNADADGFVTAAIKWFGYDIDAHPITDPVERGRKLADLVRQRRTLLILDGLEPLQELPDVDNGRLKDKGLKALIESLAADNPGLLILTSRQELPELTRIAAPRVRNQALDALDTATGTALLKGLGVFGRPSELEAAVASVGGHALSVGLLGSYLSAVCAGDVTQRDTFDFADAVDEMADTQQSKAAKRARLVMEAYVRRFDDLAEKSNCEGAVERMILSLVGLFDRPADALALQAVLSGDPIPGLTDVWHGLSDKQKRSRWGFALKRLRDLKLISAAEEASRQTTSLAMRDWLSEIDAHPLVRDGFGRRLAETEPEAYRQAHDRLYRHYSGLAKDRPDTLAEMQPLFHAIAHGCKAGRWQEVFDEVYYRRVDRGTNFLNSQLGGFGPDLGALAHFFETPWHRPHPSLTQPAQAVALSMAGFALRALGRLRDAVEPMRADIAIDAGRGHWKGAAPSASNLSELRLTLGDVADAVLAAAESVAYADRSGDAFQRMVTRTAHADALHQAGDVAAALALYQEAERLQAEMQPELPRLYSLRGYQYCDLLLALGRNGEVAERGAYAIEVAHQHKHLLSIALDTLSLGRAAHQAWVAAGTTRADSASPLGGEAGAPTSPSPRSSRGEGRGEGQRHTPTPASGAAPHPNPSPQGGGAFGGAPHPPDPTSPHRATAQRHLDAAVEGLRKANAEHRLPWGLLARAAFRRDVCRATGDATALKGAEIDLAEVQEIAERGGMRLFLADLNLEWVRLLLAIDPALADPASRSAAEGCWTGAAELIAATGYHRRDAEVAALRAALDALTPPPE
ncbi:MAG: TIR domain-containing protein [Hyphomicrobiaceae bacterium]|nr:TIR domain-containing protein [Hyphomicrobiaceae bacterium]